MELLEKSDGTNDIKSGTEIKIDYFTVTFEFRNYDEEQELKDVEDTVNLVAEFGKKNLQMLI